MASRPTIAKPSADEETLKLREEDALDLPALAEQRCYLVGRTGPAKGLVLAVSPKRGGVVRIGKAPECDLVLADPAVSRVHCEITRDGESWILRDLQSTNGTILDGTQIRESYLRIGATLGVGESTLAFTGDLAPLSLPPSENDHFGALVGRSMAMRTAFALFERISPTDATMLLSGETGTGKSSVARAIHGQSKRGAGPFVVFDCGAIAPSLIESELFGHEKGAFTGAEQRRIGALEQAEGGTLFIDELEDLRKDLQAKLLRALEERTFQRVGSSKPQQFDARVIAATRNDLATLVTRGRFREDLYFRLAVFHVELPALRMRREDLPALVNHFAAAVGRPDAWAGLAPDLQTALLNHAWPGNIRELRNAVERAFLLADGEVPNELAWGISVGSVAQGTALEADFARPFKEAKEQLNDWFEREYITRLVSRCAGNVARAAREAGIDRSHLYTLLRKHGLDPGDSPQGGPAAAGAGGSEADG